MNLTHDAMLVSLRISAWSGRLYDRKASNHVAVDHEACHGHGWVGDAPSAERKIEGLGCGCNRTSS